MDIASYLKIMPETGASDLFFSTGAPVNVKIDGVTSAWNDQPLPPGRVKRLAYSLLNEDQIKTFEETLEMNLAVSVPDIGRFRVNVYRTRGETAMVIRYIKSRIPTFEELHLPAQLKDLVMEPRGLILLVGATGSGKSTTLAAMIAYRNGRRTGHILTIEDPIEFIHHHNLSIVNQREIGLDTLSYANALKNAMREAPDVILIGEIRDRETMQQAIVYAETGHLCLATLHANDASQTLYRIVNLFPDSAHHRLLQGLALNLRAVVSQRLVYGLDGGRLPAVEILMKSPYISELIARGDIDGIKEVMEKSGDAGLQTFDQALHDLYRAHKISLEEALEHADARHNLLLKVRFSEDYHAHGHANGLSIGNDAVDVPAAGPKRH